MLPLPHFIATLLAALAFAAPVPVLAQDFSAPQKKQIENIVRDYLLTNPEILRDAYAALEAKQARAEAEQRAGALKTYANQLTQSPYQAVVGNPKGKVTLVEFFDYNCGYCKQALPDLTRLMKEDSDLRVVLKDFPVLGPGSVEAAQVAIAVKKQFQGDKFWAFHVMLLGTRGQVGKAQALAAARDSGADMDRLAKDMEGPEVQATLQESAKLADALNLTGTPTYVVGDEVVVGAVGYAQIKGRLENVRKCGKASCG